MKSDIGKFAIVPEWLLDSVRDGTAIRLFAILAAKHADRDTNASFPSRLTLAAELGAGSRDTVDRAVRVLVDAGALLVTPRVDESGDRTSNLYTLIFVRPGSRTKAATPSRTDEVGGGRTEPVENQNHLEPEPNGTKETPPNPLKGAERARKGSKRQRDLIAHRQQAVAAVVERYQGRERAASFKARPA